MNGVPVRNVYRLQPEPLLEAALNSAESHPVNAILANSQTESPVLTHPGGLRAASGLEKGTAWSKAIQQSPAVAYALGGTHAFDRLDRKPGRRMLSLPFCAISSTFANSAGRPSQNPEGGP